MRQTTRTWVMTEAVKSHLAMAERGHPGAADMARKAAAVKEEMLEEWSKTKRAPRHAAWLHEKELTEV